MIIKVGLDLFGFLTTILHTFNDSKTSQKKYVVNQILLVFKREKSSIWESIHQNKSVETEATLGNEENENYKKVTKG